MYVALVRKKWINKTKKIGPRRSDDVTGGLLSWWRRQEGPPSTSLPVPVQQSATVVLAPSAPIRDFAHLQSPPIVLFSGDPIVQSVYPSVIPSRGGMQVTITGINLCDGGGGVTVVINGRSQIIISATPVEVSFLTSEQSKSGVVRCSIESNTGSYSLQGRLLQVGAPVIITAHHETDHTCRVLRPGDTWHLVGENFGYDATNDALKVMFAIDGDVSFKCQSVCLVHPHSTLSFVVPIGYGSGCLKLIKHSSHSCVLDRAISFGHLQVRSIRARESETIILEGGPFPCDAAVSLGDTTGLKGVVGNHGRELRVKLPAGRTGTNLAIQVMLPGEYIVAVPANLTFSYRAKATPALRAVHSRGSSSTRRPPSGKRELTTAEFHLGSAKSRKHS